MSLIFYTSENSITTFFTQYYLEQLSVNFPEIIVVSVKNTTTTSFKKKLQNKFKLIRRKKRMWSWGYFLEFFFSYPLKNSFSSKDQNKIDSFFKKLITGNFSSKIANRIIVDAVNGKNAIAVIRNCNPDIIIQAGAGLLKTEIINIPKIGVLNIHHGIAPLIRGMDSIYWAKWEQKKEWLGATIHFIDAGIDTGKVLKYVYPDLTNLNSSFSDIFCELSVKSVEQIIGVTKALLHDPARGNIKFESTIKGISIYKSGFSGFRILMLQLFARKRN